LPLLERAQAQEPDNPRVNFSIGLLQSGAKRYPEAIEALKRAVAQDQTNDRYYFNLGAAYERLGDFDNAVTALRKSIELNAQGANALNYLGYMYADRGINLDESIELVRRALLIEPENGYYIDSLGWAYFKKGMLDEAMQELKRAVALVPDDPIIVEHLGDIYFDLKMFREAQEAWERSLQLQPESQGVDGKLKKVKSLLEQRIQSQQ
jgi:tetratricopeptide (TPR) repeat protein